MRRGFKAEAERHAAFYRKELQLKERDPLPSRDLASHLKIQLLTPQEIPGITEDLLEVLLNTGKDNWSAAILRCDDKEFIIYNPTHSPYRQESDLMHEIAHSICKHEFSELETTVSGGIIPLRKYDKEQEDEAGWLGACLQLPRPALFYYHKIKRMAIPDISKLFNASEKMVHYRLGVSGVKNMPWRG
ncbi:MAG: ImmA/IrrE family metallo-endopeptidase [Chitinophagaceae bacterium]